MEGLVPEWTLLSGKEHWMNSNCIIKDLAKQYKDDTCCIFPEVLPQTTSCVQ